MARIWQRPLYHVMYATPLYVFIIVVVTSFVVGLRSLLVDIALGIIDPGTAIRPRVLARVLLG